MQKLNLTDQPAAPHMSQEAESAFDHFAAGAQQPTTDYYQPQASSQPFDAYERKGTSSMKKQGGRAILVLGLLAVFAGTATGYGAHRLQNKPTGSGFTDSGQPIQTVAGDNVSAGQVFGSPDEETFKDSAEGYLELGGLDGEGSHKLLRDGGPSQTVYLTSSSTDLDDFDGMQVKVWGETFKAQKAGWLMDVGRVQVIKTEGSKPAEFEE